MEKLLFDKKGNAKNPNKKNLAKYYVERLLCKVNKNDIIKECKTFCDPYIYNEYRVGWYTRLLNKEGELIASAFDITFKQLAKMYEIKLPRNLKDIANNTLAEIVVANRTYCMYLQEMVEKELIKRGIYETI